VWPKERPIHVIHDAAYAPESFNPEIDGLVWMSRQRDQDQALILFGDRIGSGTLTGQPVGGALHGNHHLRQQILTLALRCGIDAA
jgi:hypothetical protein